MSGCPTSENPNTGMTRREWRHLSVRVQEHLRGVGWDRTCSSGRVQLVMAGRAGRLHGGEFPGWDGKDDRAGLHML